MVRINHQVLLTRVPRGEGASRRSLRVGAPIPSCLSERLAPTIVTCLDGRAGFAQQIGILRLPWSGVSRGCGRFRANRNAIRQRDAGVRARGHVARPPVRNRTLQQRRQVSVTRAGARGPVGSRSMGPGRQRGDPAARLARPVHELTRLLAPLPARPSPRFTEAPSCLRRDVDPRIPRPTCQ
jgi:hypothetical protein